jgi:hypothetical protein
MITTRFGFAKEEPFSQEKDYVEEARAWRRSVAGSWWRLDIN